MTHRTNPRRQSVSNREILLTAWGIFKVISGEIDDAYSMSYRGIPTKINRIAYLFMDRRFCGQFKTVTDVKLVLPLTMQEFTALNSGLFIFSPGAVGAATLKRFMTHYPDKVIDAGSGLMVPGDARYLNVLPSTAMYEAWRMIFAAHKIDDFDLRPADIDRFSKSDDSTSLERLSRFMRHTVI